MTEPRRRTRVYRFTRTGKVLETRSWLTANLWNVITLGGAWEVQGEDDAQRVTRELTALGKAHPVEGNHPVYLPPDQVTIRWGKEGAPVYALESMNRRGANFVLCEEDAALARAKKEAAQRVQAQKAEAQRAEAARAAKVALNAAPVITPKAAPVVVAFTPALVAAPTAPVTLAPSVIPEVTVTSAHPAAAPVTPVGAPKLPFTLPAGASVRWLYAPGEAPDGAPIAKVKLAQGYSVNIYSLESAEATVNAALVLTRRA